MKKLLAVCLVSALGLLGINAWASTAAQDTVERFRLSTDVLTALMNTYGMMADSNGCLGFGGRWWKIIAMVPQGDSANSTLTGTALNPVPGSQQSGSWHLPELQRLANREQENGTLVFRVR